MGAGSSSVEKVKIHNTDNTRIESNDKVTKKSVRDSKSVQKTEKDTTPDVPEETESVPSADNDVASLTQQLCESESQRLDLEDRVQYLEEQLSKRDAETLMTEEKPCDETLHAKDQYIAKLEKEKNELEQENKKIKLRQRKKLKQLSAQMTEYKQETNFQMMELKEDIERMREVNSKLKASPGSEKPVITAAPEEGSKFPGGEKMKLILDLSEQVTEQSDKIARLERKLEDKGQVIDELRMKLRNSTGDMSAEQDQRKNTLRSWHDSKTSSIDSDNNRPGQTKQILVQNIDSSSEQTLVKQEGSALGLNSNMMGQKTLFSLPEEDESEHESENMTKLSSLLQGVKADKKTKVNRLDSPLEEERSDSRTGRDSGLGSAGKVEQRQARVPNHWGSSNTSDWNSGSGLSDSEHESSSYQHSKISSAPAKLQNTGKNPRLKKKSNSLRKRSAVKDEDRPPKPTVAFEQGEREEIDRLLNMLPPVMPPVDISA